MNKAITKLLKFLAIGIIMSLPIQQSYAQTSSSDRKASASKFQKKADKTKGVSNKFKKKKPIKLSDAIQRLEKKKAAGKFSAKDQKLLDRLKNMKSKNIRKDGFISKKQAGLKDKKKKLQNKKGKGPSASSIHGNLIFTQDEMDLVEVPPVSPQEVPAAADAVEDIPDDVLDELLNNIADQLDILTEDEALLAEAYDSPDVTDEEIQEFADSMAEDKNSVKEDISEAIEILNELAASDQEEGIDSGFGEELADLQEAQSMLTSEDAE